MQLIITIIISILAASLMCIAVGTAFDISTHPWASLIMRFIFLSILTVLVVLRRKEYFVYLFLIAYPFLQISFNGVGLLTIFALLLMFIYFPEIVALCNQDKIKYFRNGFLLIFISIVYTTILAHDKFQAMQYGAFLISTYLIYLVLINFLDSMKKYKIFLSFLWFINIFALLVALWQIAFGVNSIRFFFGQYNANVILTEGWQRIPSFFTEAQGAGLFISFMIIIQMALLNILEKSNKFLRRGIIVSICVGVIVLLINSTRMSFIALLTGLMILILFQTLQKRVFYIVALAFIFLFTCFFFKGLAPSTIKKRFSNHQIGESYNFRFNLWKGSLPIFYKNPLGVGLGGINLYNAAMHSSAYIKPIYIQHPELREGTDVENTYLHLLYSLGVIGVLGFLLIIYDFFRIIFLCHKQNKNDNLLNLSSYLASTMVIWIMGVFTCPRLYDPHIILMFIYLLALSRSLFSLSQAKNQYALRA